MIFTAAMVLSQGSSFAYASDDDASLDALRLKVDEISRRLEPFTGVSPKIVISGEQEMNAHVLPDRTVIITKNLLDACASDDEIAFIIAHEIGHLNAKDYYTIKPGLKSGDNSSQLHEINADINGVFYAKKAGFDPNASLVILKRIAPGANGTFLSRLNTLASFLKTLQN